jgi:maleylacetate reductase
MTPAFTYDAIPGRVVFGPGSRRQLADEARSIGSTRVLLVAGRHEEALVSEVSQILGSMVVGHFDDVAQHVPVAKASDAVELVRQCEADTVVTIGGGSATGFGKAIALECDVRLLAIPTTYAGSEMTTIWGLTDGDHKQTGNDLRVKPDVVVYDPELTLSLPPNIAGPSGMNALAHSVEAMYGPGANPVITAVALESIAALARALPIVTATPDDLAARSDALYGAYLAGVALATGGTALHHKTCHVLGGMFGLDHGGMNAVVLSHALAYNAPAIPDLMPRIATALGVNDAVAGLQKLASAIGAPTSLEALGMPADGIDEATRRVVNEAAANVRLPEVVGFRTMIQAAFSGKTPA